MLSPDNVRLFKRIVSTLVCSLLVLASLQGASRSVVRARHALVVSADKLASEVGISVLKRGGNAVDAAVAVGFALAVVFPEAGNLGGGGFMLVHRSDGRDFCVDFREKAPARAEAKLYLDSAGNVSSNTFDGQLSVGVPGTVAGFAAALEEYGTLSLAEVIQPAINLAERGFIVDDRLAAAFEDYKSELLKYPSTVRTFTRNGFLYAAGDTLRQPALATTLRRIQQNGVDGFYRGETAKEIIEEMERGGGIMSYGDLKDYRARLREPISNNYRGYEIVAVPPPSSGGLCLFELLNLVEGYDLASMGFHSSRAVHVMTESMKRVYADRAEYMGDPDFIKMPVERLRSKEYASQRLREIDSAKATTSQTIHHGNAGDDKGGNTTHYSIIDPQGNIATTTYTLNDMFGSKVVAGNAGFFLNDEMDDFSIKPGVPNAYGLVGSYANAIEPGKRMLSSMTPTIVMKDRKPVFILGARGGSRIITSVFEAIVNVIDFGMNGQEAVDFPRFHHQWLPDTLMYEKYCFADDVISRLRAMGHHLAETPFATGEIEGIFIDREKGIIFGVPDPREGGVAVGF